MKLLQSELSLLLKVFPLNVKAEVSSVCEEFGVDGEGGIAHMFGLWCEWSIAFLEVAVGEGESELSFVPKYVSAATGLHGSIGPALASRLPLFMEVKVVHVNRKKITIEVCKKRK